MAKSLSRATERDAWGPAYLCLLAIAVLIAIVPFAHVVFVLPTIRAIEGSLAIIGCIVTGLITLNESRATRELSLAIIGAAYLFCTPLLLGFTVMAPGVIPGGAWTTNDALSPTPWLFVASTVAIALAGIVLAIVKRRRPIDEPPTIAGRNALLIGLGSLAAGIAVAVALGELAVNGRLPRIFGHGFPVTSSPIPLQIVLLSVAVWSLLRLKQKSRVETWFIAAQALNLLAVSGLALNLTRYSVPWYYNLGVHLVGCWCVLAYYVYSGYERYERIIASVGELSETAIAEQQRFAETVNNAAIGIAHIDAEGKVLFANDQLCLMLGLPPGILSRVPSLFDLLETSERDLPLCGDVMIESRFKRENGDERWLEIRITSTPQVGANANFYIAVVSDVTARKAAEQAMVQMTDIKSQFIATMSHEIRTPLSGIVGVSELFKRTTPLTEKQRRFAETIDVSAQSLLQLVNDVLDFSRIEAAKLQIERSFFDLHQLVDSVREAYAREAGRKGLRLVAQVAPSLGGGLYGDPVRLRQILDNLVSNAVKFTESGQVSLTVSETESRGSEVSVRFRVQDTGIGISADAQQQVFEAFAQADTAARHFGGTGLGLAIVKKLVDLMGGRIELRSELGRGSTFSFGLWLERDVDGQRLDLDATLLRGVRALVVSGDGVLRQQLNRRMLAWGMRNRLDIEPGHAFAHLQDALSSDREYECAIVDFADPAASAFVEAVCSDPRFDNLRFIVIVPNPDRYAVSLPPWRARVIASPVSTGALYGALAGLCVEERRRPLRETSTGGALGFVPVRPERILVAEDNEVNRMLVLAQLEELGFGADFVEDGAAAIAAAETGIYALIFMDSQMPKVDGLEATAAIRKREAGSGQRVPIIAMTANTSLNYRETCLAAGMDDYVAKPVLLATLQSVLDQWLARASVPCRHSEL